MRTGTNLYFSMLVFAALAISSTAQTGGTFDLSHNVIASGGGASSGNGTRTFSVEGTIGQGFAGTTSTSTSPQFSVRGGFWAFQPLAPTAATVTVAGRVTAEGRGLSLARVLMTNSAGDTRTAITNIFGYYSFADVPVGETFLVTVSYPRYNFAPRVLVVDDEITGFDFVALLRSGSK